VLLGSILHGCAAAADAQDSVFGELIGICFFEVAGVCLTGVFLSRQTGQKCHLRLAWSAYRGWWATAHQPRKAFQLLCFSFSFSSVSFFKEQ
jgi:hypothetical protein